MTRARGGPHASAMRSTARRTRPRRRPWPAERLPWKRWNGVTHRAADAGSKPTPLSLTQRTEGFAIERRIDETLACASRETSPRCRSNPPTPAAADSRRPSHRAMPRFSDWVARCRASRAPPRRRRSEPVPTAKPGGAAAACRRPWPGRAAWSPIGSMPLPGSRSSATRAWRVGHCPARVGCWPCGPVRRCRPTARAGRATRCG